MRLSSIVSGALLALLISATLWAAPVTYLYTGPNFNSFTGSPVAGPGDHISAMVTFSAPLLPNSSYSSGTADIIGFSISDGHITLSSAELGASSGFLTDGSAQILTWTVTSSEYNSGLYLPMLLTWYQGSSMWDVSQNPDDLNRAEVSGGTLGVWELQETGVPEPGTLSLLFAGCVFIGLIRRRASVRP